MSHFVYVLFLIVFFLPRLAWADFTATATNKTLPVTKGEQCPSVKSLEQREVCGALRAVFDALEQQDSAALKTLIADDFLLFENGEKWTLPMLIDAVFDDRGRRWTLTEHQFTIQDSLAHVSYKNTGFAQKSDGKTRRRLYLESALFIKQREGWQLTFLQSTRYSEDEMQ